MLERKEPKVKFPDKGSATWERNEGREREGHGADPGNLLLPPPPCHRKFQGMALGTEQGKTRVVRTPVLWGQRIPGWDHGRTRRAGSATGQSEATPARSVVVLGWEERGRGAWDLLLPQDCHWMRSSRVCTGEVVGAMLDAGWRL